MNGQSQISKQSADQTLQKTSIGLWYGIRNRFRGTTKSNDAKHFTSLMAKARSRWLKTGEIAELDAAISYAQQAVEAVPSGQPARIEHLKALWTGLYTRFQVCNQIEDVNRAILCQEEAVESAEQDHPSRGEYLKELGVGLYLRYQMKNELSDLDQAVSCGEKAIAAMSVRHTDYSRQLGSLAVRLLERYKRSVKLEDLNQAIMYGQRAVDVTPKEDSNYIAYLNQMVVSLASRYEQTWEEGDLEKAISFGQQIVNDTRANDPDWPSYLTNVGNAFHTRFLIKSNMEDLNQAIAYGHQALDSTNDNHPDYPWHVGNLGARYNDLYTRSGRLTDLEQAVLYSKMAVDPGSDSANNAIRLVNLGVVLHALFQAKGQEEYLNQAMSYGQQAVDSLLDNHFHQATFLRYLGIIFLQRFEQKGLEADLQTAEKYTQQALEARPKGHPGCANDLCTLGSILRCRFRLTGFLSDINEAIVYGERALDESGKYDSAHANYSVNLAISLTDRFELTGHMTDLEHAIQHFETAVDATPREFPKRAEYLASLSSGLRRRFQRRHQIHDLDRAIKFGGEAVQTLAKNHIYRPTYLNNLAHAYRVRFKRERKGSDLELAAQHQQETLSITSEKHPEYMAYLDGLSSVYELRYQQTGNITDLDEAIHYSRRAIDASSKDNPDRAMFLLHVGHLLFDRYRLFSSNINQGLRESTEVYQQALSCSNGFPLHRVIGGSLAAWSLAMGDDLEGAIKVLDQTLVLVPKVTSPTNSRDDMQYMLPKLSGLGILAASVFCRSHRSPMESLYALENCRGIIASIAINARSDTALLKDKHPRLWSRYTKFQEEIASIQLNKPTFHTSDSLQQSYAGTYARLQQFHKDLDETRDEIRTHPGFERFLLSPTEKDMQELAKNGYIACLNSSAISSEAFLITPKRIWVLPLPELHEENTAVLICRLARGGNSSRRDALITDDDEDIYDDEDAYPPPFNLSEHLEFLWKAAVKPILQELGVFRETSDLRTAESIPRIWWVGRGKLGFAPLHAAGDHSPGSTENTLSHVLSSYAPTLKALQFIQERSQEAIQGNRQEVMLVSMPTTPGYDDLNVTDEVAAIKRHVKPWASVNSLEYPSKQEVLSALKSCTVAHFACHGAADRINPAKSALLLGRKNAGQARGIVERLTVEDLDTVSSNCAQIIYLSACSTAESKVQDLVDEDIHLASTFQLLGFPHVICTLWGADDDASVEVAKRFYEELRYCAKDGNRSVAEALHKAVLCYRNTGDNWRDILKWAPFIHLGC